MSSVLGSARVVVATCIVALAAIVQAPSVSAAAASAPAAPSITSTVTANGSVTLNWSTPADNGAAISAYKVYRGTSSGSLSLLTTTGVVNTYTSTGLTNGTTYYFAVSAVNSKGEGAKSSTASAVPATSPAAPIVATPTTTTTSATFTWSAPANNGAAITGYNVYRGATSSSLSLLGSAGTATTYTDNGLTAGTTYYYAVTAVNAKGESVKSNVVSAMPVAPPNAPVLSPIVAANGSATLTWTAPAANGAPITQYKVYRGTTASTLALVATLGVATTYTNTGLTNGSTYFFGVTAVNSKGESAQSNVVSSVPSGPPAAPVASTPTINPNGSLTLTWTTPANNGSPITGYNIYHGTTSSNLTLIASLGVVNTFTNTGLNCGASYYYAVVAVNTTGTSPQSNVVTAIPTAPPDAPIVATPTPGNGTVALSWTVPAANGSAITGYKVYRGTTSSSLSLLTTTGLVNTYTNTGLTNGTTYYYAVSAVNGKGEGGQSTVVSAVPTTTPGAPTLASPTVAGGSATLTWTAPASTGGAAITGYNIYQGPASASLSLVGTIGATTTYTATGLTNGSTYYFAVVATNPMGDSVKSNVVSAVPAAAPDAPVATMTSVASNAVTVGWTTPAANGSAITGYKVYRGTTSSSLSLLTTTGLVSTYTNTGLTNGTTYYYAVTAVNAKGESVQSNVVSGLPAPAPSAPTLATPTVAGGSATLTWTAPTNGGAAITGYKIYQGPTDASLSLVGTVGATTTYTATGLTNGTAYYFAVVATNPMGDSVKSNVVSAVPAAPPTAPVAGVSDIGDGTVTVGWTTPAANGSAITGYKVYRGTSAASLSQVDVLGLVNTYDFTALDNGTTYYFAVVAVNAKGDDATSNVVSAMPAGPPLAPTISTCVGSNSTITIGWTAPDNNGDPITGYTVFAGTSASTLNIVGSISPATSYTKSGLTNGTTYYFALTASNSQGPSAASATVSCVPASVPHAPVLSSVVPGSGSATLTWTTPANNGAAITAYKIYRGPTSTGLSLVATVSGTTNTYVNTGLVNGTTYYFAVRSVNSTGDSAQSNVVAVTCAATTTTTTTTVPSSTTTLPPGNVNDPNYWSALGYGICVKNDSPPTPYILPSPPAGYSWSLLVIKAGSESSNSDWLTQIPNPQPGTYYHPSGKQISHVIYCKKPNTGTTTTTATTTTVVGGGCETYTPTHLAISDSSAEPGQSVVISGSGVPNDNLVITIARAGYPDATIGFAVVDGAGNFSVSVIIPDSYPPGSYTITVRSHDCTCVPSGSTTSTTHHTGGDDDDGGNATGDDDAHNNRHGDDDGSGHDGDDDSPGTGPSPCAGATTLTISVTSLDLTGCGTNNYDRVFSPGETITWHLMGSPFNTSLPPVTLTLVSRTPGGPTYTLYSGTYPGSLNVTVTVPAAAPLGQYYLNQTGKKNASKVITKSCPVRVGLDAILVSSRTAGNLSASRSALNLVLVGVAIFLLSILQFRRAKPERR